MTTEKNYVCCLCEASSGYIEVGSFPEGWKKFSTEDPEKPYDYVCSRCLRIHSYLFNMNMDEYVKEKVKA